MSSHKRRVALTQFLLLPVGGRRLQGLLAGLLAVTAAAIGVQSPSQEVELLDEEEGESGSQSQQPHDEHARHVLQPELLLRGPRVAHVVARAFVIPPPARTDSDVICNI